MNNKFRVCIDARLFDGVSGGVQQFIIGLANGLSKLNDGNEEYFFLTYSGLDGWLKLYITGPCKILNIPYSNFKQFWKKRLKFILPLIHQVRHHFMPLLLGKGAVKIAKSDRTIENAGINVMHFATQNAFVTNIPNIYHPHDLQHIHLPHFFSPLERLSRKILYRKFCDNAQIVAVASTWVKNDLVKNFNIQEDKLKIVPLAPILDAYKKPLEEDLIKTREKFLLPQKFVFYPAQTWAHKNHLALLDALTILRDQYELDVPFVFSGKQTNYFQTLKKRGEELSLQKNIKYLGFVSPLELQCLYKLAHCVVIPTKFEAGSFPIWEAFLAGVPVACSNVTSLPEQAGEAALIFNPNEPQEIANAIYRLWTEEPLCKSLIEKGKSKVKLFSWERTARIFRAYYRLIGNRLLTEEDRDLINAPPLI